MTYTTNLNIFLLVLARLLFGIAEHAIQAWKLGRCRIVNRLVAFSIRQFIDFSKVSAETSYELLNFLCVTVNRLIETHVLCQTGNTQDDFFSGSAVRLRRKFVGSKTIKRKPTEILRRSIMRFCPPLALR